MNLQLMQMKAGKMAKVPDFGFGKSFLEDIVEDVVIENEDPEHCGLLYEFSQYV